MSDSEDDELREVREDIVEGRTSTKGNISRQKSARLNQEKSFEDKFTGRRG